MNDIKFKAYLKLTNETVDVQKIDIENKQISFYKNNDDGYLYVCDFKNIEFIFDQQDIRQQLAEKGREMNFLIADYEKRISQAQELMSNMEHQLAEKQNTIDEINNEFVQAIHDWKALCAEKDTRIADLEDKDWYESCIKLLEKQNIWLIDTFKEKDKEIELLNAMISTLPEHDKEIKEYELEKVKDFILENTMLETETAAVLTYIYQQIKELKGEKT